VKKMRRLVLLTIFLAMCISLFVSPVAALAGGDIEFQVKGSPEEAIEVKEEVDYQLTWPGILPDHPLYKLKMVRDRIWGFLVRDPINKARWSLLMADKRIWASQLLMEKGKMDLAVTTATKAEKYLEGAVNKLTEAKNMGKEDRVLSEKVVNASWKHEEILETILTQASEDLKPVVQEALGYPQSAREKVLILMEEK
jgi:hypothetical protein